MAGIFSDYRRMQKKNKYRALKPKELKEITVKKSKEIFEKGKEKGKEFIKSAEKSKFFKIDNKKKKIKLNPNKLKL